jgi:hypothetical protein
MKRRASAVPLARLAASVLLLALTFWLLAVPVIAFAIVPQGWSTAGAASIAVIAAMLLLALLWPSPENAGLPRGGRWPIATFWTALGVTLAVLTIPFSRWVSRLILLPIDPNRADMLVQINAAIDRLSTGQDPYFVYHVPWELPLSYGPWLWTWFMVPRALHADIRMTTAFGQLFVPALTGIAAALAARASHYARAVILLLLAWTVLASPLFDEFILIGHTPAYWPLLAAFALLSSAGAHKSAAVLLGLLIAARTPMVALVPVFLMHLWFADRTVVVRAAGLLGAAVTVSFAPFALWDWRVLVYGLYGNYVRVIKDFVWTQTTWMNSTLGLTRVLLASGHAGLIGLSQILALVCVYALAWRAIRAGRRQGPWFCLALLAFCMTTLWPVWYIFFDVFLLGICFLLADETPAFRMFPWRAVSGTAAVVVITMAATLAWNPGVYYTVEAGQTPRWHFRSGFGPDEVEGARTYAWAMRPMVHMRLPRGFRTDADIQVECDPFVREGIAPQLISASLNGAALGQVQLRSGWQVVSFRAKRQDWQIGHNDFVLSFAYVWPDGTDTARAVRIARVKIAPAGSPAPDPR